jgi:hypothetical protein
LEVPFGRAVRVVDQHQVRIVLQSFGLLLHRFAILLDELSEYVLQQILAEGKPPE